MWVRSPVPAISFVVYRDFHQLPLQEIVLIFQCTTASFLSYLPTLTSLHVINVAEGACNVVSGVDVEDIISLEACDVKLSYYFL